MQRILIVCATVIALIAASCSTSTNSTDPADPTEPTGEASQGSSEAVVSKIGSIDDLRSAFSEDDGAIRIVLSMSPT